MKITIPAPTSPEHTAWFGVDVDPMEPGLGCVQIYHGEQAVTANAEGMYPIAAHESSLQRLVIGHTKVLVHVEPGSELRVGTHPCFGWQFTAPDLSVEGASQDTATCKPAEGACPPGTLPAPSRHASDPLCPDRGEDVTRCVRPSLLTLNPPSAWTRPVQLVDVGDPNGEATTVPYPLMPPMELLPRECGFPVVKTGAERVSLAIGIAQHWTLSVDPGGRLTGSMKQLSKENLR